MEDGGMNVRAGAEEEYHSTCAKRLAVCLIVYIVYIAPKDLLHKRVRKPHLRAVHNAIPDAFHERKDVVILRIQYNLLGHRLLQISKESPQAPQRVIPTSSACNRSIAAVSQFAALCASALRNGVCSSCRSSGTRNVKSRKK